MAGIWRRVWMRIHPRNGVTTGRPASRQDPQILARLRQSRFSNGLSSATVWQPRAPGPADYLEAARASFKVIGAKSIPSPTVKEDGCGMTEDGTERVHTA